MFYQKNKASKNKLKTFVFKTLSRMKGLIVGDNVTVSKALANFAVVAFVADQVGMIKAMAAMVVQDSLGKDMSVQQVNISNYI